jgi:hypothetical protein
VDIVFRTTPLYGLLQQLTVLFKPLLWLFHIRCLGPHDIPESVRMVRFDKMGQFVDHNVVDNLHGRFDQAPVEGEVVFDRAGATAVTVVYDTGLRELDAELAGVMAHAGQYLLPGAGDVPASKCLQLSLGQVRRNEELLGEFDPAGIRTDIPFRGFLRRVYL